MSGCQTDSSVGGACMISYDESNTSTKLSISYELEHDADNDKVLKVPIASKVIGVCVLLVAVAVFICWKVVS